MSSPTSLAARAVDSQPRSPQVFIPLFIVAGLLVSGISVYVIVKLFARIRKLREEERLENLKQELESGAGHSSVTCCGTAEDSKSSKFIQAAFDSEVEEIVNHHGLSSHGMFEFPPSPSTDISPARRSSSIFFFRSESLPLPNRALLRPSSSRRASIPVLWNNPRSRWADENHAGYQGKPSHRPATSPFQKPKGLSSSELVQARRSITPMF
ncbi:hypothetical protein RSOLAG1IB_01629 [Rhizoctonia solani AG-1 IB]|uniref:Uncharacterized protein n=1 Tax=Thanatephorus cucumeris (strain AG1-IB / isolate 7/3/14) TaxID=1108050 RepID=A0A0B7FHH1_THACB|nr:hypothetical protein RSOLAG1IB_01629 [Rhizoctonia solani AG-1 IB]